MKVDNTGLSASKTEEEIRTDVRGEERVHDGLDQNVQRPCGERGRADNTEELKEGQWPGAWGVRRTGGRR